jgi:hypothetical protein
MDDALLVSRFQRLADLLRDPQCFINRYRTTHESRLQRLSLHQFHDDATRVTGFLEAVDMCNIGVIQGRKHLRFTTKTRKTVGIASERVGEKLDRNAAFQLGIGCLIHVAHTTRPEVSGDFVMC